MVRRTLRKLKREWDNAVPPQVGLEPIIGGIYGTPPVDPRDCGLYPDSPWCGGNPISQNPIAYNFSLVRDECNIGVQLDSVFGFIKMPSVQIVYRNPNCKLPELPEPELPSESYTSMPDIPLEEADFYVISSNEISSGQGGRRGTLPQACSETFIDKIVHSLSYSPNTGFSYDITFYQEFIFNGTHAEAFWSAEGLQLSLDNGESEIVEEGDSLLAYNSFYKIVTEERKTGVTWRARDVPFVNVVDGGRQNLINYLNVNTGIRNSFDVNKEDIIVYSYSADFFPLEIPGKYAGVIEVTGKGEDFYGIYYYGIGKGLHIGTFETKISIFPIGYSKPPQLKEPLPPPLPRMSCCPNVRENDELLRLIAKRLGAYDYPVNVPKYLTDRSAGTESIENLTRFHSWLGKNLDALVGKFPIDIKIKDSDIDQEGNQEKHIKIPNMAEALAEIIGYLLVLRAESDANLNATIRALTEAGAAKQSAILASDYARANAEFLAYKGEQIVKKVPYTFKPGEPRLDKMLVNSEVGMKSWENEDKEDIKDLLQPLLELAAMYRAQNFRNVGTGDTSGSLVKTLLKKDFEKTLDSSIMLDKLKRYNNQPEETKDPEKAKKIGQTDFDVFTEEAEKGFIDKAGITDSTNPYGKPFDERPKIREIGKSGDT